MKFVFTGASSGGHFYPVIAVAAEVRRLIREDKLLQGEMFLLAIQPFDERRLFDLDIEFRRVPAGKIRRYFSIANVFDLCKTAAGVLRALWLLYFIFPDAVFGKGGYDTFPVLLAARIFGIPVIIHESDAEPGRVNRWAGKFAARIAVGFPEAASAFPKERVAHTGNPVRSELFHPQTHGAYQFFQLDEGVPVVLILGGSQGARAMNERILSALPRLVERYQIIHQTGHAHLDDVRRVSALALEESAYAHRYRPYGYVNDLQMAMAAGAATVVVTRAGAGAIAEVALWGIPAVVVPIPESVSHDQRRNAYAYARTGAAVVIEEHNFSTDVLMGEIDRIVEDAALRERMGGAARAFARPDAATKIAEQLVAIALRHER